MRCLRLFVAVWASIVAVFVAGEASVDSSPSPTPTPSATGSSSTPILHATPESDGSMPSLHENLRNTLHYRLITPAACKWDNGVKPAVKRAWNNLKKPFTSPSTAGRLSQVSSLSSQYSGLSPANGNAMRLSYPSKSSTGAPTSPQVRPRNSINMAPSNGGPQNVISNYRVPQYGVPGGPHTNGAMRLSYPSSLDSNSPRS